MEQLSEYFNHFIDTPDGIKKLRELILTLAMQGKLVKQDPNDQSASELIVQIEKEKLRLIAEGKIKKAKPLPEISEDEVPYELPAGWEWVRLGTIASGFQYGTSRKSLKTGAVPFFEWAIFRMEKYVGRICNIQILMKILPNICCKKVIYYSTEQTAEIWWVKPVFFR
jgi:hypothetical protein